MKFNVTLAHAKNDNKLSFPVFQQPKLDGIRCYFTKDGAFSRNHKKFMNLAHLEANLQEFFSECPDLILDGELYNHKLKDDFEKIVSLVRKQKPTSVDRIEAETMIQYHIYDVYSPFAPETSQKDRVDVLKTLFKQFFNFNPSNFKAVPTELALMEEQVQSINAKYLDLGYEGTMLRSVSTPYKQKRSWDLQKVKSFKDTEGVVISVVEGKGKLQGKLGKFIVRDETGVEFGCPATAHTHPVREEMWNNRSEYIGKTVTFTYFERTKRGVPRFPIYKCVRTYE